MQEPYGAYSWYPVNDQPSDKALYDFTISTPAPWVGVANGELVAQRTTDGRTTTQWRLDEPASSYLVTLAIGDFTMTAGTTAQRPADQLLDADAAPRDPPGAAEARRRRHATGSSRSSGPTRSRRWGCSSSPRRARWRPRRWSPSATTTTCCRAPVIMHEIAHQWYGDIVSPSDWRDVWMNEGMTMYLQGRWEAEHGPAPRWPSSSRTTVPACQQLARRGRAARRLRPRRASARATSTTARR